MIKSIIMKNQCRKKTKIIWPIFALICSLFSLSSCNESKFLDKPDETNLEFWITEEVKKDDFVKCTFLPGLFGGNIYLDSRYKAIISDDGSSMAVAPEVHVIYTITAYPDYADGGTYVTGIDITDPKINVYGLTMTSSQENISKTMSNFGFTSGENNRWSKNNCVFTFKKSEIIIVAKVTNDKGIIF